MQPTPYPIVNSILDHILSEMQAALGDKLTGLYLYGSLVTGDFDLEISDMDLLAAVASDIDEAEFYALKQMQDSIVLKYPAWDNRIEIAYLSLHGLQTFKTQQSPIAIISPGEPFHIKEAGKDWLVNWYMVREKGMALYGPPPITVITPISKEEFIVCVKNHAASWAEWLNDIYYRGSQAYAILTLCRALYTVRNGEQVSKLKAAAWAQQELPEWAGLIQNAVQWRQVQWREEVIDHERTLPETQRFVHAVIAQILHI